MRLERVFFPAVPALLLALAALPGTAGAFSLVNGSFKVEPGSVTVSRTITLTAEIEDEQGLGAGYFEVEVSPNPPAFVRLVSGGMPQLTCKGPGSTKGRWVYEAVAPGKVEFHLTAAIMGCKLAVPSSIDVISSPVEVKPLPLWSGMEIVPDVVRPGETFELRLSFRNDADFEIVLGIPEATPDLMGGSSDISVQLGKRVIEPASVVKKRHIVLAPGRSAKVTWRYRAKYPGQGKFLITGGGMVVTSPPVSCRGGGALAFQVPELESPFLVGREMRLRGKLLNVGEAQVRGPAVSLTWSPAGSARLVGSEIGTAEGLHVDLPPLEFMWRLQIVEPGPLSFRLSASATEADSGLVVRADEERSLQVLPPPDLDLDFSVQSTTVLVGERADFRLVVRNQAAAQAQNIAPILAIRRGRGRFTPLNPVFQGVPARGRAVFTGAFIPTVEGPVELSARITGRGERGGPRVEAQSDPVDLLALPEIRMDMFTLNSRARTGKTEEVRFLLVNRLKQALRLNSISLGVSGGQSGTGAIPRVRRLPLTLAPGAGATMFVRLYVAPSSKTEHIMGSAMVTGEVLPHRIPFSWQAGSRLLAVAGPPSNRIAILEPGGTFDPVRDISAYVEYTLQSSGMAGLAVLDSEKRVVRKLAPYARRDAGWHAVRWDGTDDAGKPVPPATYTVRLAGPATGQAAGWPADVKWKQDIQLMVTRQ